ncbi:MAG TPA: hypothetical protein VF017_03860 [Thermoanaerobaculia bacterium]|nr:hypothetical protein [Thermoanaerobaculia bacterium]
MTAQAAIPPPRPARWEERAGGFLFRALAPRLAREPIPEPPAALAPFEELVLPRRPGHGSLTATWYAPAGEPRGGALLLHPWMSWGKAYFHRRGRIPALREAGYGVLALDLPGFGGSHSIPGFYDRAVVQGLEALALRVPGRALHVWGVSNGGYWAHIALSSGLGVAGAFFEDVSPHLLEWSWRTAPLGRPFYLFYRLVLPRAYRFLDARRHAAARAVPAVGYVSGELDRGVRPEDTHALADAAGAERLVVPDTEHLGSIKRAGSEVIAAALETFSKGETRVLQQDQ